MADRSFSPMEIDAIGEILNISLGASATAISTMLDTRVDITTPLVNVVEAEDFTFRDLQPAIGVEINYVSGLEGKNIMLLKRNDIKVIVELLMGTEIPDEEFELDEMNLSAICEVMNQMMGASSTALSEFLERPVNISTPVSFEIDSEETFKNKYFIPGIKMVVVKFLLNINGKLESEFVNVMPTELVKELLSVFLPDNGYDQEDTAAVDGAAAAGSQSIEGNQTMLGGQPPSGGQFTMGDQPMEGGQTMMGGQPPSGDQTMMGGQPMEGGQTMMGGQPLSGGQTMMGGQPPSGGQTLMGGQPPSGGQFTMGGQPPSGGQFTMGGQPPSGGQTLMNGQYMAGQPVPGYDYMQQMMSCIQNLQNEIQLLKSRENRVITGTPLPYNALNGQENDGAEQEENLELLMGVSLEIAIEIGRTRGLVKDILEYKKGSLVVLDKQAGDPVDLYVNGRCIAKGDVVVVDDSFGIRISEIVKKPV